MQEDEAKLRDKLTEVQDRVDGCLRDNLDTPGAIFQLEALIRAANLYRTARDSGLRTGGEQMCSMHDCMGTHLELCICMKVEHKCHLSWLQLAQPDVHWCSWRKTQAAA